MKHWLRILVIGLVVGGGLIATIRLVSQPRVAVVLRAPVSIQAGEAWELAVTVQGATAGETLSATLFNGLHHHQIMLELGTGGVALWQFPKDTLIYAGRSLLSIRYGEFEIQRLLEVLPNDAQHAELLTTTNTLPAYGERQALIMALLSDQWGNPPQVLMPITAVVQFPDTRTKTLMFEYANGLGWSQMTSLGQPGRVRITLTADAASAYLELMQTAGEPETVDFSLAPICVLMDGREVLALTAEVSDAHGYAVADGTLVVFSWKQGFGYARTLDGRAALRLSAPTTLGVMNYYAQSGNARSDAAALRVVDDNCARTHQP